MTPARTLWHGTTRRRAEKILLDGPNVAFIEPGAAEKAGGFSTAPPQGPYQFGDPRDYAARKAVLFPDEGGPAILEIEVGEDILALATNQVTEIRFQPGFGLEELRAAWQSLPKRIIEP